MGATGYIGGATLALLLKTPSAKSYYSYAALVMARDKATRLEALGVCPVIANLSDVAVLEEEVAKVDIVVHTANSAGDLASSQAILRGLKKRGGNPILIQVAGGKYTLTSTPRTSKPFQIAFRAVALDIIEAAPFVHTHLVVPPTIYGVADHALVTADIVNPLSIQMPSLIRAGIDRGQGAVVGKGLNLWRNVHIDDIASAIMTVLEAAVENKAPYGKEGYYFAETGEHNLYEASAEIARAPSAHGIGSPEPTPLTEAEIQKYYGGVRYARDKWQIYNIPQTKLFLVLRGITRQLGWIPIRSTIDFIKSLAPEVEYILKKDGVQKS